MGGELLSRLRPVHSRQQVRFLLHWAAWGWLMGASAAVAVEALRLLGVGVSAWWAMATCVTGLAVGMLFGAVRQRGWKHAACAIDAHYGLKDRATSALDFVDRAKTGEVHQLQIADAVEHLAIVKPREVVPLRIPRPLPYAAGLSALAIVMVLWPIGSGSLDASPTAALPAIVDEAERLEALMVPDLEMLAAEQKDERLEALIEELKVLVEEMKQPGVDLREALAKLSSMEAAVSQVQSEFNLEAMDAGLQELGEALAPAAAMKSASSALSQGKYGDAAEQLEQFDASQLSNNEARTLSDNLKKLAKKMKDRGQGQFSEAAGELSEGLDSENQSQCKDGACKLAGLCKKQGLRKAVGQCLACQLALLSECKGSCQSNCNKNGGQGASKSDSPKLTWGLGASGQPLGDQAKTLGSTPNRQDITGMHGDGPSEREVTHSPEGRQQAAREYREKYAEYRRMSEAVLESEPLPLGHRQTIRRYFESIRPQEAEVDSP
ncbi:MAG: hypothetical protein HY000_00665 [Planctomycetes bacterium]|nr:hypothetical protein [Planctomycetota bacterium]